MIIAIEPGRTSNDIGTIYNNIPSYIDKGVKWAVNKTTELVLDRQDFSPNIRLSIVRSDEFKNSCETAELATKVFLFNAVTVILVAKVAFLALGASFSASTLISLVLLVIVRDALDKCLTPRQGDIMRLLNNQILAWGRRFNINVPPVQSETKWIIFRDMVHLPGAHEFLPQNMRRVAR